MFQIVDTGGHFILKPQNLLFPEIPQVELSPAYDLVNTTIALKTPAKELALPLRGKKNNLQSQDFFEYLAASA